MTQREERAQIQKLTMQLSQVLDRRERQRAAHLLKPCAAAPFIEQARHYMARGLPISACLLLMCCDAEDAYELTLSREYEEARWLICARTAVAHWSTHWTTWPSQQCDGRLGPMSRNLERFVCEEPAPPSRAHLRASSNRSVGQVQLFEEHDDHQARTHTSSSRYAVPPVGWSIDTTSHDLIKAGYLMLLLLTQTPELRRVSVDQVRWHLWLSLLNGRSCRLYNTSNGMCLHQSDAEEPGTFHGHMFIRSGEFSKATRKTIVNRGAHKVSSSYVHLKPSHLEELLQHLGCYFNSKKTQHKVTS